MAIGLSAAATGATGGATQVYSARLVGAFELRDSSGEIVTPRSRRARALLAHLVLTASHAATRDSLAALLWSERGDVQARASLRQALFELRPLAEVNGLLTIDRTTVALVPAAVTTDVMRFEQAVERHDLPAILATFGEPDATLLLDLGDLDPAFDDWLQHRRTHWREGRRAVALRACHAAAGNGTATQALPLARLLVQADPLDEAATVALMELAHADGDIAAVRRAYATLVQELARDLGVSPSQATSVAYQRLQSAMDIRHADPQAAASQPAPSLDVQASGPGSQPKRRLALVLGTAIAALVGVAVQHGGRPASPHRAAAAATADALPDDPQAAALFLQARDDAAQRNAQGLDRAVSELQRVVRLRPNFAPGFAALADAYLLAGEAGSLSEAVAFDGAEHAADRAEALDPKLASAHRAKGFILYWWQHRAAAAGTEFRNAIQLDSEAALSHFWYANILADAGQQHQAMREFDRARLSDPGSDQIGADFAWAQWIFRNDREALARLDAILATRPANVEALSCAATIALAEGDGAKFLALYRRRAELREEPALTMRYRALAEAYRTGGTPSLLTTLTSAELADQRDTPFPDHSDAAFYASLSGDRQALLRILSSAVVAHERWGAAGYVARERERWADDPFVLSAIAKLAGDHVEESKS